jgi:hypothetical protein
MNVTTATRSIHACANLDPQQEHVSLAGPNLPHYEVGSDNVLESAVPGLDLFINPMR